ncbi:MAG: hypothetical protein WCJ29_03835 [bacterium]
MTLSTFSLIGSILSLLAMIVSFIWVYRRGKFEVSKMNNDEAGEFVTRGTVGDTSGKTYFKGKAWGMSMGAEISTLEVLNMVRAKKYSEAAPWLFGIFGALAAMFFWPFWVLEICNVDDFWSIAGSLFFLACALRAAWPRKTKV